jgi:FkbM family methyltransferase
MDIWGRVKLLLADQSRIGIISGSRWNVLRKRNARGRVKSQAISLRPARLRYPLEIRMQSSSDPDVFDDIFHRRELTFLKRIRDARVIIDLGANVGYVSAFCLSAYKHGFVLSVEPDPANHLQCTKNLRHYGNRSRVLCAAVWHTKGDLLLSRGTFGDGRGWATEVREPRDGEKGDVYAWDVPSLIAMCPQPTIDLLKIDIEGSEAALFSGNVEWLDRVKNMCIELHGSACEQAFRAATAPYRFEELRCGEYTICLDIKRVASSSQETGVA